MKTRLTFGLMLAVAILAVTVTVFHPWSQPAQNQEPSTQPEAQPASSPKETSSEPVHSEVLPPIPAAKPSVAIGSAPVSSDPLAGITNKLERLNRIRETFVALAGGSPTNALRAAKDLTNETERETALLALATQWTQGHLGSAQDRASFVARYGIEAGIGIDINATRKRASTALGFRFLSMDLSAMLSSMVARATVCWSRQA